MGDLTKGTSLELTPRPGPCTGMPQNDKPPDQLSLEIGRSRVTQDRMSGPKRFG